MIINTGNLAILFRAFNAAFQRGLGGVTPMWDKVATRVPSTTGTEDYGWLGSIPGMREWIGDRQINNLETHDYSIKNKKFENTVGVPRDKVADDQYGVFSPMMEMLGNSAPEHRDIIVFALLALGFETACYDKQYFFDTDHPVIQADGTTGSVSNMQAGSGNPWFLLDTRRPLKPLILQVRKEPEFVSKDKSTDDNVFMSDELLYGVDDRKNVGFGFWQMAFGSKADLDTTNFDGAMAAMGAFKGDHGNPLGILPNLLVIGPSNRAAANAVVATERLANGGSNTNFKAVEILVVPWLA